jgi:hypothetical protein
MLDSLVKLPALYFIETLVRDLHCDVELNTKTIHSGGLIIFSTLSNIILMLRIHALYNRSHRGEMVARIKDFCADCLLHSFSNPCFAVGWCVVQDSLMFWEPLAHAASRPIFRLSLTIVVKSFLKNHRYSYTQ